MTTSLRMSVVKRDGHRELVNFEKITRRIERLAWPLGAQPSRKFEVGLAVDATRIAAVVCASVVDGIATERLDELTADVAAGLSTEHPDYGILAARIVASNLQKQTSDSLSDVWGRSMRSMLAPDFVSTIETRVEDFHAMIDYDRDFDFDYFGFKTMEKMYLTRVDGKIVERPQHMYLRVAIALWGTDTSRVKETYDALSTKKFTHASPTLFNAGLHRSNLASCFLLTCSEDSIAGIYDTLTKCAHISKYGGGIGVAISNVRSKGSKIKGTNGESDGIVPMARVFDATVAYVNQGGRRKGALAMYIEPHHPDVFEFLDLKRNQGDESLRARNLFYAMWISDLFMRRVESNGMWSLFDPSTCPGLDETHGDVYAALYERYESEGAYVRQVRAQDLWTAIVRSQIETGGPYILFKDAANGKSNQQNLGTIKCSNLCVAGDTKILTSTGYHPIGDLVGQHVRVWNGDEFSETTIVHTGKNQPLVTVTIDNGSEIRCTPYHKFFVVADTFEDDSLEVRACDLVPGHRIFPFRFPDDSTDVCVSVVSVVDHGDIEDTFCFNEPKKHAGMFNGILAGNCSEIIEYTSKDEIAVCTLGSLSLPAFVDTVSGTYDFDGLLAATRILARNLDRVIDVNFYPLTEARTSNERHRPVGVGVQGLADVFFKLKMPFDSPQARSLNRDIFETIYFGCISESNALAKRHGPYSSFDGSPASRGKLQFDLWDAPTRMHWDWDGLKKDIVTYGLRNSLSVAPMPTASTAQLLSNVEAFEPQTSNLYSRRTIAGEFPVINTHLVRDLISRGTWSNAMKNQIVAHDGSIQRVIGISAELKAVYKTAWELSMKNVIDMAADRGAFVCQSQSMNVFVENPTIKNISSMLFYGWKRGLKTGTYYLRSKAASGAIKITASTADCISCSG